MHWFKISLLVLLGFNALMSIIGAGMDKRTITRETWHYTVSVTINLLLLFGVLIYL